MAGRNFHPHIREARTARTTGKPRSANEWAQQTRDLRARLGISQSELARLLDCSAMTVSRWEKGRVAPSAHYYIELGKLAGKPDCWFYWEKAGLQSSDVVRVLPERERKQLPAEGMRNSTTRRRVPRLKWCTSRCYRRLPERMAAKATSGAI